jgi:hypothetical protein
MLDMGKGVMDIHFCIFNAFARRIEERVTLDEFRQRAVNNAKAFIQTIKNNEQFIRELKSGVQPTLKATICELIESSEIQAGWNGMRPYKISNLGEINTGPRRQKPATIKLANKSFAICAKYNMDLVRQIDDLKELRDGMMYVGAAVSDGYRDKIALCSIIYATMCPSCKVEMNARDLIKHNAERHAPTAEAPDGYVSLEHYSRYDTRASQALSLIPEIPIKYVPSRFDVYIPKWVEDAIRAYDKDDGFASMPLEDYLRKMVPTKETQ